MQLQLLLHFSYLVGELNVLLGYGHHIHLILELILQLPFELLYLFIHFKVHCGITFGLLQCIVLPLKRLNSLLQALDALKNFHVLLHHLLELGLLLVISLLN